MKEVVCLHLGQCGIQLSNAAWELFCVEHGIQANGFLKQDLSDDDSHAFKTFFQEVPNGQYVPRAISFDLEPTVIDEVRTGAYRNLFHPDQLINGMEDAANNFARGKLSIGKNMIDVMMSQIRSTSESCDRMQNFFILNSFGGGTGAGFTALLLERLCIEYAKRYKVQLIVTISPVLTTSVVEPYNAGLSIHSSMDYTDLSILTDNEAAYHICLNSLDIPRPTYANLNRLIAQVFSDMTASIRFEGTLNSDMDQLTTNLVPYPRIHFPLMAHAPNVSESRANHQPITVSDITRMVFDKNNQLVTVNPESCKYMSCCLQYRGDVTPKDVNATIYGLKKRQDIRFVNWCPTGFKIGINSQPCVSVHGSEMAQSRRSVSMLTNTSAINQAWISLNRKFDLIFRKRAFVHWFVSEGMEEGEMNEAFQDISMLMQDYEEISHDDEELDKPGKGGYKEELDPLPTFQPMSIPTSNTESDDEHGDVEDNEEVGGGDDYEYDEEDGMGDEDIEDDEEPVEHAEPEAKEEESDAEPELLESEKSPSEAPEIPEKPKKDDDSDSFDFTGDSNEDDEDDDDDDDLTDDTDDLEDES